MIVKFKKLMSDAVTPTYAKVGDAALDITCINSTINREGQYVEYETGLAVQIPEKHVGLLFPRSSISNQDLSLCNAVGVIDSGYRGEIKFRFRDTNKNAHIHSRHYQSGDRIGQLLIIPVPHIELEEVKELSDSIRGNSGYGSSGK